MGHEVRHHKLKQLHHKHRLLGKRDEIGPPPLGYPPAPPPQQQQDVVHVGAVPYYMSTNSMMGPLISPQQEQKLQHALADVKRHSRNERIGEVGAVAAGAFAMYELHEAKVDPEHARRHKLEAKLAGAVAVGSANYAYHEHKEKKKSEHLVEVLSGGDGRNPLNAIKKKESVLAISNGHKHHSKKNKDPLLAWPIEGKHNTQKERKNLLQVLSGGSSHSPSTKHQESQKKKQSPLLW